MEQQQQEQQQNPPIVDDKSLKNKPGIIILGSPNVGKRTLLSRLSVDGDSQGVERFFGALSAYMWPGMILKSGDRITEPSLPEPQDFYIFCR